MSDKTAICSCQKPYWIWLLGSDSCNEECWHCANCRNKAPGEPLGYRPDLDSPLLQEKVDSILMELHNANMIYISNGTDGECIAKMVTDELTKAGYFDQYSIIQSIMRIINRTHADFWKQQGDSIRAGKDIRDRCSCGKLATMNGTHCHDCGWAKVMGLLAADPRGPETDDTKDPWQAFGEWAEKWREEHPDDERDDLELIEEYGKEGNTDA